MLTLVSTYITKVRIRHSRSLLKTAVVLSLAVAGTFVFMSSNGVAASDDNLKRWSKAEKARDLTCLKLIETLSIIIHHDLNQKSDITLSRLTPRTVQMAETYKNFCGDYSG